MQGHPFHDDDDIVDDSAIDARTVDTDKVRCDGSADNIDGQDVCDGDDDDGQLRHPCPAVMDRKFPSLIPLVFEGQEVQQASTVQQQLLPTPRRDDRAGMESSVARTLADQTLERGGSIVDDKGTQPESFGCERMNVHVMEMQ